MLLRLLGNPRDWLNPIEVNSLSFILLTLKMTTMPLFLPFFFLSGFLLEVTINYTSSALAHLRMISILQKKVKKSKIISKKFAAVTRLLKCGYFVLNLDVERPSSFTRVVA